MTKVSSNVTSPLPTVVSDLKLAATVDGPNPESFQVSELLFYLNGKRILLTHLTPETTLLQYLRSIGLTGSKLGCGEGGCGACTVLVSSYDPSIQEITHIPVNACLAPLASLQGKHVITIEALGSSENPHPVQQRMARMHGSQCGFCTPGIVMSMYALLRKNPHPTEEEVEEAFDGNLCRCTGYRPILDAAKTFSGRKGVGCCMDKEGKEGGCCRDSRENCNEGILVDGASHALDTQACDKKTGLSFDYKPYDPSRELIFPPALILLAKANFKGAEGSQDTYDPSTPSPSSRKSLMFTQDGCTWYHPHSLREALRLRQIHPTARIIAGNTEVGVEMRAKRTREEISIYLSASEIPELGKIKVDESEGYVSFGGNLTLERFSHHLITTASTWPEYEREHYMALYEALKYFAGQQIRSVATIAGNLATASPISDLSPVWMALDAQVELGWLDDTDSGEIQTKWVPVREFFLGYRKTQLDTAKQLILSLRIRQKSQKGEYVRTYKVSRRKDDDIALVNAALSLIVDDKDGRITSCYTTYGGMAPIPIKAEAMSKVAVGRRVEDVVRDLLEEDVSSQDSTHLLVSSHKAILMEDFSSMSLETPGGMPAYRLVIAVSLYHRLLAQCLSAHITHYPTHSNLTIPPDLYQGLEARVSRGAQSYDATNTGKEDGHGEALAHISSMKQTCGEAQYIDDQPPQVNEAYSALVLSERAHGRIRMVDASKALSMPGVLAFYSAKDVPGQNGYGVGPVHDEVVFAENKVESIGQSIGIIVAESSSLAAHAARHGVDVQYEDEEESEEGLGDIPPGVYTIDQAIQANSFFPQGNRLLDRRQGSEDLEEAFAQCDHVFQGEYRMGGQEHFYLETQGCRVVPLGEDGREFEVYSSSQNLNETQVIIAEVLGLPAASITARARRIGGGFGGKETKGSLVSSAVAIAAFHLRRPIRLQLERDDDMLITGHRHPFKGVWKVGVDSQGMLQVVDLKVYANGGRTMDLSAAVVERCVSHADNCYWIPRIRIEGKVCRTRLSSNTAFRGFGGPQGMLLAESWVSEVADKLGMPVEQFREKNMYREGQITPFGNLLEDWHVPRMWKELKERGEWLKRREEVDKWNAQHRYRKRGIAMIPTKFGISFGVKFLNQAGALINIYTDGTILLSHGGVEMGQGLHTKMAQIASRALRIPVGLIHIRETSTASVPNASPTAASASSDMNGAAIQDACLKLRDRILPYLGEEASSKTMLDESTWKSAVKSAYLNRVHLSQAGFYSTPKIGYDWTKQEGTLYYYYTMGVAIAEVEVDGMTGEHRVLRADVLMDIGRSINPAIDIGQIEGAFVQGMGWSTMEELVYSSKTGGLITRGPGNYKIPGFRDVPEQMHIHILEGAPYPHLQTIRTSKGVGEPPLFLGSSVLFAIRDAVKAMRGARKAFIKGESVVRLESPATVERIRLAIGDSLVQESTEKVKGGNSMGESKCAWAMFAEG